MSTTHLAGIHVTKDGRYVRQRCAWCGEILVDEDASLVQRPIEDIRGDETPAEFVGTWPAATLVRIDGPVRSVVESDRYPEDCCMALDPEITR